MDLINKIVILKGGLVNDRQHRYKYDEYGCKKPTNNNNKQYFYRYRVLDKIDCYDKAKELWDSLSHEQQMCVNTFTMRLCCELWKKQDLYLCVSSEGFPHDQYGEEPNTDTGEPYVPRGHTCLLTREEILENLEEPKKKSK